MNCEVRKKSHLLKSLAGEAGTHIVTVIKHNSTYEEIMDLLSKRPVLRYVPEHLRTIALFIWKVDDR